MRSMRSLILLAVTLASVCLLAQDSDPNNTPTKARPRVGEHRPQPCVVQPVPLSQPAPDYSDEGQEKKVEGRLSGFCRRRRRQNARRARYQVPGTVNGKPVAVKLRGSVSFHLR